MEENKRRVKEISHFSSWHYGAIQSAKEKKHNKVEEINRIGTSYAKSPNNIDATKLIEGFHGYIMKYVKLLTGSYDGAFPRDTQQFLSLFGSTRDMSYSERNRELKKISERLPNMAIQSLMVADDIYNELVIIFLDLARKFNPDIGGFTGYVQHHFKYAVKTRLFQIQNDALNYQPLYEDPVLKDEDPTAEYYVADMIDESTIRFNYGTDFREIGNGMVELSEIYYDLPILNYKFIDQPSKPFDIIWTKQQRAIMIKFFLEDKSLSAIAEELGYNSALTIRKLRDDAFVKYKEYAAHGESE